MNLTDTDVLDHQNVPALPSGVAITGFYVFDKVGSMTYMATPAQVAAQLFPPALPNLPPTATLTLSASGALLGDAVTITITAADPDGQVTAATVYDGTQPINTLTSFPATFTYVAKTVGTHVLKVVALDNQGAAGSDSKSLEILPVLATAVITTVITFPSTGSKAVGDAPFTLSATSNSPAPITFASSNAGVISVSGNTATIVGNGTVTLTASQTATSGYTSGTASQGVEVAFAPHPVTYTNTLTGPSDAVSTVTLNSVPGLTLGVNLPLSTTAPTPAAMLVYTAAGTQVAQVDYNDADTGAVVGITYGGILYNKALVNGPLILS